MIDYRCTNCGEQLDAPESMAGQAEACPSCQRRNVVPVGGAMDDRSAPAARTVSPRPSAAGRGASCRSIEPHAVAAVVCAAAALTLYFSPWIDLAIIRLAPYQVAARSASLAGQGAGDHDQRPAPTATSLLIAGSVAYGLGVAVAVIAAMAVLSGKSTLAMMIGFGVCCAGSMLTLAGWHGITSDMGDAATAAMDAAGRGLTGWCYLAMIVPLLGLASGWLALAAAEK